MSNISHGSCNCICHKNGIPYLSMDEPDDSCCACHNKKTFAMPSVEELENFVTLQRLTSLESHKNLQIEENRKISRRIDEMETLIFDVLLDVLLDVQRRLGKLEEELK